MTTAATTLALLGSILPKHGQPLQAHLLMGNHVHLLASAALPGSISQALRIHGQFYVPAFNRRHRRTGTLSEERFKSCLVDFDRYLLTVYLHRAQPVRAAMVATPEEHHCSSVHAHLGHRADPLLTSHAVFDSLGL